MERYSNIGCVYAFVRVKSDCGHAYHPGAKPFKDPVDVHMYKACLLQAELRSF